MLSDIENLDIMLGENHFERNERNESVNSNQAGRPESLFGDEFGDENENGFPNPGNNGPSPNTELGHNSIRECSSVEINRLSSELNSRISREMDEMMNSVSVQIQRAINEAISSQILPQIQNVVMAGSGQLTKERWNVPAERPEGYSEALQNSELRNNSKNKQTNGRPKDGFTSTNSRAYDMVTGENESPIEVPEFLTGRISSRNHLDRSYEDINLDTTIPAQERNAPAAQTDPITRLADVLTTMQNRPTAQQLTIRPVNSNTMTFDGKSEKFELFEDLFHTMIKMQPEMTEQMKINHFHSLLRKNALQTFRNISSSNRQTLEDVLVIFRRKYVKPESQATAKHKWHRLVFDPNTMKLPDFLE